ncbi:hypothetical protein [Cohnella terricola]|uniref:Uncharacterized protein n=1 Tax=Cohnella terricola TaxID=1289167 RepID=A0A559JND6_9BACL|nr:hypothetical protein [Cohnella terricola]TVY01385.1 hypothetical protein FPZ45_09620 [Cohnella terricola]
MPLRKPLSLVLLALLIPFVLVLPRGVSAAATIELTSSVKVPFDKTVAAADKTTAEKLNSLYGELAALLKEDNDTEAKIKALHYKNEEIAIALRKQIREIDAAQLAKLATQVQQAKARYKPLLDSYSALNKQISAAKTLKNKTLNSTLRTQADLMKPLVQLAREEIKTKEAAHKSAKTAAAKKIKAARDSLAAVDPLKVQIKAQRNAVGSVRDSRSPVWSNFKSAGKKSDIQGTQSSLTSLVSLSRQIATQQQKIYALEVKIADILSRTQSQIL